jgi:hypothetical protein
MRCPVSFSYPPPCLPDQGSVSASRWVRHPVVQRLPVDCTLLALLGLVHAIDSCQFNNSIRGYCVDKTRSWPWPQLGSRYTPLSCDVSTRSSPPEPESTFSFPNHLAMMY